MTESEKLLKEVEDFLVKNRVRATPFGIMFANDSAFVIRLREGRKLDMDKAAKLREFMANYKASKIPKPRKPRKKKKAESQVAA